MGMNFKYSHWVSKPIDRSYLSNVTDALEKAIDKNNPKNIVSITVDGATNTTVQISSENLAELVEIMKISLNED